MRNISVLVVLVAGASLAPFFLLPSDAQAPVNMDAAVVDAASGDVVTVTLHDDDDSARETATEKTGTQPAATATATAATTDNSNHVFDVFGRWVDEKVDTGKKFLENNVYNQRGNTDSQDPFDRLFGFTPAAASEGPSFLQMAQSVMKIATGDPLDSHASLDHILSTARQVSADNSRNTRSLQQMWELFTTNIQECLAQLKASFDHVSFETFNPIALYYFVELEDERKNPSWKRRKHRYHKSLDVVALKELHDALYLSQLAYANTVADIQHGMKTFVNNSYELIYSKTEGFPGEPAHFLALKKDTKPLHPPFPWQAKSHPLEILFVVRGTKELGDALSDGLLVPGDYRDGKVHGGIGKAGRFLVDQHIATLQHLLSVSKRDHIRLTLVGHSLGAGAAAIAAMEFNDYDWITAHSIGFGCPALLSLELGRSTKDYITTVVSDADVVPRTSGASLANMLLDVMSYDWTSKGMEDVEQLLDFLNDTVPFEIPKKSIMDWVEAGVEKNEKPFFGKVQKDRLPMVLYPPGTCIHLFRDGSGYTGTYTPCEFFDEIEFSRTLVEDHLIPPGYHRAMVGMLREHTGNLNEDFVHDLMAIPT
jgi:hypothetical protein